MARALIKINGSDATTATVAIGSTVLLSNDGNGGEVTYAWSFLDQPEGTGDTISTPAVQNASFVPTKEGTYQVRLVVNALLGTESIQTAAISVLDARTGQRIPAATETTETSTTRGWALSLNRILAATLHASVDSNVVVALSPGSIAAGRIVKLGAMGTANAGTQAAVDLPQAVAVNATITVVGRVGIAIDGVIPGDLGSGKLILVRMFGLVPFVGTGSPTVGDAVFLSDSGVAALIAGTVSRTIGRVVFSSAGSYRWVVDGVDAGGLPALAAIATSGSASDLTGGTVPAARMPALTGNVTSSAGSVATTIAAGVVTNAMHTNMAANTFKANNTGGSTTPTDITTAQAKTLLAIAAGDVSGLAATATSANAANLTGTLAAAQLPALTGNVTTSAGSAVTAIAAHVVTYAMETQAAANTIVGNNTGGTADKADLTIAQVIAMLGLTFGSYGNGSDGPAVMDGSTAVAGCSLASGVYKALRSLQFTSIVMSGGAVFQPDGYEHFCNGAVTGTGTIDSSGGDAVTTTAGTQTWTTPRQLPAGGAGVAGGGGVGGASGSAPQDFTTGSAAGGTSSAGVSHVGANGGIGGGGGGGGSGGLSGGAGNGGGAGGALTLNAHSSGDANCKPYAFSARDHANVAFTIATAGGGGGSAGSGGGAGGASGAGGSWMSLHFFSIAATITIKSKGGKGGNGVAAGVGTGAGGGGGGGSGGGGLLAIETTTVAGSLTTDVTAGTPGSGGAPDGTSFGGAAGGAGGAGKVYVWN